MWESIIGAIEGSDSQLVKFYLLQDPNLVYEQNYQNETLLHFAAKIGDPLTVNELISRGARADIPDAFGWTPLHEAVNSGREDIVALFITTGISLNPKTSKQETPLHSAARKNYHAIMARLLDGCAHKNPANKFGNTPLHLAAQFGFTRSVEVLLAAGANVNARNLEGSSPLHLAAIRGHTKCADLLLRNKANPEQLDKSNRTFFDIAEIFGNRLFIEFLLATIAEVKELNSTDGKIANEVLQCKSSLSEYFTDEHPGLLIKKEKDKVYIENFFRDFIFGSGTGRSSQLAKGIGVLLWFVIFPLLLFILWHGFSSNALSPIINIDLPAYNEIYTNFIQTAINTLIVIMISYLFVSTDKAAISQLHFFKNLRESVPFRILHLAMLETYFFRNLVFNPEMARHFFIFWAWFFALYSFSFLIWWADTHYSESEEKKEDLQFQNSH